MAPDQPRLHHRRPAHRRRHRDRRVRLRRQRQVRRRLEVLRRRRSSASCSRRCSAGSPSTSRRPRRRPCARSPRRPAPAPPPRCSRASAPASSRASTRSSPSPSRSASAIALGDGNIQFTFYLVALTGMGMLATTGVVVSEDTFGPVADNAAGIAEMSGEFEGEPERIMVSLDAVGNTTKAVTKGFAIGSAVIASVALFASYVETIGGELEPAQRTSPATRCSTTSSPRSTWPTRRSSSACSIGGSVVVPVLGARDPRRRPHRRRRGAGGPQPVRRRRDHGRHQEARLRPGHRHLHRGLAARARHAGAARGAHAADHRVRHQLSTPSARSSPA